METYGDDEMSEVKEAASCSDHGGNPSVGDAGGGGSDDLDQGLRSSIGCREKNRRCREELLRPLMMVLLSLEAVAG